ncbi:MAG: acyl carrier protein [Candidatus Wallbacteria bacterium]|nr:acyl carrier protein [Candidatus Wallbacteria bacterium]
MNQLEIFDQVRDIVCKQLSVSISQVKPEDTLIEALGADSLDTVELVMSLEEKFEVEIPDAEVQRIRTVQDVANLIIRTKSEN